MKRRRDGPWILIIKTLGPSLAAVHNVAMFGHRFIPRTVPASILLLAVIAWPGAAKADEGVDYLRHIKPILAARCYACHGALEQKNGLRLDTAGLLKRGGDSGPAVVPGKSGESLLVRHVTGAGGATRMPPESEGEGLKPEQIAAIRRWIDPGAAAPADEKPETDPRDHWAFRRPVRPAVPEVRLRGETGQFGCATRSTPSSRPSSAARPDAAAAGRQARAAAPRVSRSDRPAADARRDRGFRRRPSPDAYEKVVDRLLASPQLRRALGPALDGHLALQRLVGPGGRGPQQPEAHLALARLDHRVAQRRQGLRPDGPRDARRRRAVPDRPEQAAGDRLPGPAVLQLQPQHLAGRDGRAHARRRSSA